ncbi:hypothetical protein MPNT_160051 [Candidatus Methylacidithermus pantelleriae]|uniref:Uncharacterized protein n=1 Tax=Candidatus Methylacidithermus pantelleriae TaxID=2744239 RepID=A0A8J2BNQ8_9BACT|nr:hypothetical protein MPNT_160051 [Candidatus Methylacidithermus pantelleriae]
MAVCGRCLQWDGFYSEQHGMYNLQLLGSTEIFLEYHCHAPQLDEQSGCGVSGDGHEWKCFCGESHEMDFSACVSGRGNRSLRGGHARARRDGFHVAGFRRVHRDLLT